MDKYTIPYTIFLWKFSYFFKTNINPPKLRKILKTKLNGKKLTSGKSSNILIGIESKITIINPAQIRIEALIRRIVSIVFLFKFSALYPYYL